MSRESAQPVEIARNFLVVVPDPRHINARCGEFGREFELHGDSCFHIDRAATGNDLLAVTPCHHRGQIVVNRHGVDVSCNDNPPTSSKVRSSNDRISIPNGLQVGCPGQRLFDAVGEQLFCS